MSSILPYFLEDPIWMQHQPSSSTRMLDQHFGVNLDPEDVFYPPINLNHHYLTRSPAGYLRKWRASSAQGDNGSTIHFKKDKFQANLDVQQFKPEELSVKICAKNVLTIEGKHEEKQDQHGFISRHFIRKYVIPERYDISKIESKLSSDGVLFIQAPSIEPIQKELQKNIPVIQTGVPAKQQKNNVEQKKC